jgi:hypothetical protein
MGCARGYSKFSTEPGGERLAVDLHTYGLKLKLGAQIFVLGLRLTGRFDAHCKIQRQRIKHIGFAKSLYSAIRNPRLPLTPHTTCMLSYEQDWFFVDNLVSFFPRPLPLRMGISIFDRLE